MDPNEIELKNLTKSFEYTKIMRPELMDVMISQN